VKYRPHNPVNGKSEGWKHATLSSDKTDYSLAPGSISGRFHPVPDGKGVFLSRNDIGKGPITWHKLTLPWLAAKDGLAAGDNVEARVFALQMVHIPTGPFFVGDGVSQGRFHAGGNPEAPYRVTEEAPVLANRLGGLWADASRGDLPTGIKAPAAWDSVNARLPEQFPTGFHSFYIMKYEITHGQYAAFLNTLSPKQAEARFPREGAGKYRFTLKQDDSGNYVTSTPTRAVNWVNWEDGIAFADWAALRPMTEMEFEKACRGPLEPVPAEYAWGTSRIASIEKIAGEDGSGSETAMPADANTLYLKTIMGPVRVGIFEGRETRERSGAGYYGALDLSGNVIEMAVTVGNRAGRMFTGQHGDGQLSEDGRANALNWPHVGQAGIFQVAETPDAGGFGYRGGDFFNPEADLRVSDRHVAVFHSGRRLFGLGFRAVRTMPR